MQDNRTVISVRTAVVAVFAAVFLCALHTPSLRAQSCGLSMEVSAMPVQQLGLADVDVQDFESRALLFTVRITNARNADLPASLHVTLSITLADGSSFPNAVDFTTEQFNVPPEGKTLTNLDIGKTKEIKTVSFQYDDAAKNRIQDIAEGTGMFPAGRYLFAITLQQPNPLCDVVVQDFELVLVNPSRVDLQQPADGATTNEFPFFEFFQDGDRATLTVAELHPGESREDAITRRPPMLQVDLQGQHSFLYAGGRPLEQGSTYAWQVVSKSLGSGGADNAVSSPIWSFTVSDAGGELSEDAILRQIEEMFGSRYPGIFEQIRQGRFSLTGSYSADHVTLSRSELLDLLRALQGGSEAASLEFE
jgi:hypothetical protein